MFHADSKRRADVAPVAPRKTGSGLFLDSIVIVFILQYFIHQQYDCISECFDMPMSAFLINVFANWIFFITHQNDRNQL